MTPSGSPTDTPPPAAPAPTDFAAPSPELAWPATQLRPPRGRHVAEEVRLSIAAFARERAPRHLAWDEGA